MDFEACAMALTYQQMQHFAAKHGNVTAWCKTGSMTMLRNGEVDSLGFWEQDATRFEVAGKFYGRDEFEALIKSHEDKKTSAAN